MKKELFVFFKTYLFTWFLVILLFLSMVFWKDLTLKETLKQFSILAPGKQFQFSVGSFSIFFYLVFITLRYGIRVYRKKGLAMMLKRVGLRIAAPILGVLVIVKLLAFNASFDSYIYDWDPSYENATGVSNNLFKKDGKHRGMHVFGMGATINDSVVERLVKNNIEWVAVVPFLYQENETTTKIRTRDRFEGWNRRDSSFIQIINRMQEAKVKVMLKPHLWMSSGWRSNLSLSTPDEWDIWFEGYRRLMLHYAKMASETDAALFCIGTELRTSLKQQPEKWERLISEVKNIYKGKLTYAANWDDDLSAMPFWSELDYIGIQAYYPLTENKNPELEEIKTGWDTHMRKLEGLSSQFNKPILFTEIGYRSDVSATIKPWEWSSVSTALFSKKSDRTQQLAYEALFQKLWKKDWFAGMFIWEWNVRITEKHATKSLNFTPQYKPAENTIAKWFGRYGF